MLTIRECLEQDYEQIVVLNHFLGYDYPVEDTKRQLKIILNRPSDKVFVACMDEKKIVGYV